MSIEDNHVSVMKSTSRLRSDMSDMMRGVLLRTEREFTRAAWRSEDDRIGGGTEIVEGDQSIKIGETFGRTAT